MYKFSTEAKADLKAITTYTTHQFGKAQSVRYLDGLKAKLALIDEFPRIGTARPELGEQLYSTVYQSHTIFYQRQQDLILIVRILHSRMDHTRLFH